MTYTITWTNNGPADATNVTMTDTLPAGETLVGLSFHPSPPPPFTSCGLVGTINCSTPSMPVASQISADVTVHVASGIADGTVLSNTASVSTGADQFDPNTADNQSTAATQVGSRAGGGGGGNRGPNSSDTPELDSLVLFASGVSGLAGYAATRLRARRRRR